MKYYYIGKQKDKDETKKIYCDEHNMRFYAMDESFTNEDDGLEYLYDVMDENFQVEGIAEYEITDPNLIKSLLTCYKIKKNFDFRAKIERIKEKDKLKKVKRVRRSVALGICGLLLIAIPKASDAISAKKAETIRIEMESSLEKDKQFENYDSFGAAITGNHTISDEMIEVLFEDFNRLVFTDTPLTEKVKDKIYKRLSTYDFTELNRSNYIDGLEYILFGSESTVYKCTAISLDSYASADEENKVALMFGELTIPLKEKTPGNILIYGDKSFINQLAKFYNVKKFDIESILYTLECYMNSTDEDEKEKLYQVYQERMAELLTNYYKNKEEITEFDRFILASNIFGGDYRVNNNIFSDYIKITHSSSDYDDYKKYYDRNTNTDVSMMIYQEKLTELIKEKGTNLDYNDPDCRFLLYLYFLCFQDDIPYYNQDLISIKSPEELARIIINDVFSEEGFMNIKKEFLYSYFTSGHIGKKEAGRLARDLDDDAFSAALYVDTINCLKKEEYLESGLYSGSVSQELRVLGRENEELFNEVINALTEGESLFDKLSFFPGYQAYKSDTVKKYVLEQKSNETE